MTRYRFRGIFLLLLMGHATACATMTSPKPFYGSIPEFIEETQPDRGHVTTEDGTVYEVTRPSVEDNAISGDYIARVGDNPELRGAPIPLDEIVSLQPVVLSEDTSLSDSEKPSNTNTVWVQLGGLGWGLLASLFSSETEEEEKGLPFDLGKLLCQSKGGSNC